MIRLRFGFNGRWRRRRAPSQRRSNFVYFSRLLDQLSEKKKLADFASWCFPPHMRSRHRISPPCWELAPILLFLIEIFPSSGRKLVVTHWGRLT